MTMVTQTIAQISQTSLRCPHATAAKSFASDSLRRLPTFRIQTSIAIEAATTSVAADQKICDKKEAVGSGAIAVVYSSTTDRQGL
jgi:hypothetical protein